MSGLEISLARDGEFEAVDRVIAAAYAHDYGPSDYSRQSFRTLAEQFDVWAAREGGEVIGSVTTRRRGGPGLHEDARPDELDLRLLGVSSAVRRAGVGAALMRHVIAEAAGAGFAAVFLKTAPNMHGAHRLYEALGFERAAERDGLWIGGSKVLDLFSYRYALAPAPLTGVPRQGEPRMEA